MDFSQNENADGAARVRVLLFGAAREAAGGDEFALELRAGATASDALAEITRRYPKLGNFGRSLLVAVNEEYADAETPVRDGDEVAIFPPVSGG